MSAFEGTNVTGRAPDKPTYADVSRRVLRQLKWLTALVPGSVVLIYEYARQETLEHVLPALPVQYGNVVVWALVLLLTYAFAAFVFRIVERLQAQALARSRDLVTLSAVIEERARLSRELHDGFARWLICSCASTRLLAWWPATVAPRLWPNSSACAR